MIPCLKQVSNYACTIYLIRLHSWTCQTKTCQYMILDVLRLHFVNWVLENQIKVLQVQSLMLMWISHFSGLTSCCLFSFWGFLLLRMKTNVCKHWTFHVFGVSVWARILEINLQVSSHAYVIRGCLLRSDPVGKHTHLNMWLFFGWKSCNIFLELIHVLKGFLCFLFTPCPPYSSNLHWPHSQRCARCTKVTKRMQ